ncbi:MAG: DCC1-like thiol-disulfide oxidoreductase family protein [Pseudomonadota bacterium]
MQTSTAQVLSSEAVRLASGNHNALIYDGDCPMCSQYVRMLRLKSSIGSVRLVNARSDDSAEQLLVQDLHRAGYDLNQGMVFIHGSKLFYGDECVHRLALLSSRHGILNRINAALFRSPILSRLLYPVLKCGRLLLLRLLGKKPISTGS